MAEPLKNQFGVEIPGRIAGMISAVYRAFPAEAFIADALDGYEALGLLPRGKHIAHALRRHLPDDYPEAIDILMRSLGSKLETTDSFGMAPFLYLPHVCLVEHYGLEHFEASMRAQHALTQRFSAEFSIRPFLEQHTALTLERLQIWAQDPSPHVRRLVSEGTRPRLPWASRLREFQRDPGPVLALLELLKDDPSLYVRRSVANNLNDIGKDHPAILAETAARWLDKASAERRWLVRHALRSAVKRAEAGALEVMGFGAQARVSISQTSISPQRPLMGGSVTLAFNITNPEMQHQSVLVDFCVHFVKAHGKTSPKVFKLKTLELAPQATQRLEKTLSLAEMTTRKHYAGSHRIEVMLNGKAQPLGSFELMIPTIRNDPAIPSVY